MSELLAKQDAIKSTKMDNTVTKAHLKLVEKQYEARIEEEKLQNVELTIYINDLKQRILSLEGENRNKDAIQNWKSFEELTEEVRKLID
jgi:ssRNA-specific RNase YbeY (16S rRNA maturation enzyme)